MVNLYQYFNQSNWDKYVLILKENELNKNLKLYHELTELKYFPDDINTVLASLFDYMFFSSKMVFKSWLNEKKEMLDGLTPIESAKDEIFINSLREYLLRFPL